MIVGVNFTVNIELAYPTGNELGVLRAKINDENLLCHGTKIVFAPLFPKLFATLTKPPKKIPVMPSKLLFSPAQSSDCRALSLLMRRSKAHWGYSAEQLAAWEQELTISDAHLKTFEVVAAKTDGELVGFYSLAFAERRVYMENLFVEPELIGKGYGRQLYAHALCIHPTS